MGRAGFPKGEAMSWERETVECVVCPGCAFAFGAEHTDTGNGREGLYSCPVCHEIEERD